MNNDRVFTRTFGRSGLLVSALGLGCWAVGGLVFGLVCEKSGGILAPALLHGLPQAIGAAVMLFL